MTQCVRDRVCVICVCHECVMWDVHTLCVSERSDVCFVWMCVRVDVCAVSVCVCVCAGERVSVCVWGVRVSVGVFVRVCMCACVSVCVSVHRCRV